MMFIKKILTVSVLLSLMLGLNVFSEATVQTAIEPDEAVIAGLLQNTSTTTRLFVGGSDDWDCCYKVVDTVAASGGASATQRMKFILTPLFSGSYSRYIKYSVKTSRGEFSHEQWIQDGQIIEIEANTLIPASGEIISLEITEPDETTSFELTNVIPAAAVAPEQALRKAFEVYRVTYGVYPTARFSFAIDFLVDLNSWLVTFDDNDGLGGQGILLIDAITGEAGSIKEDEG
jgi:hypothetical protein